MANKIHIKRLNKILIISDTTKGGIENEKNILYTYCNFNFLFLARHFRLQFINNKDTIPIRRDILYLSSYQESNEISP